jgi:two-component system sensor histidine kinase BaeS
VPEADLPRLFDRFYRGVAETGARSTGSGLGLAIVRSVVEHHGGGVEVANNPGGGAAFTVRLPLLPAASDLAPHQDAAAAPA